MASFEAISLMEASKRSDTEGRYRESDLIFQVQDQSDLLNQITFITTGAFTYEVTVQENGSPVGTRGVNQSTNRGTMRTRSIADSIAIIDGEFRTDVVMLEAYGQAIRDDEIEAKARGVRATYESLFVKGSKALNPTQFDGLQAKLTDPRSRQVINPTADGTASSGGDPLDLAAMYYASSLVRNPTHWLMSRRMSDLLSISLLRQSVTGFVARGDQGVGRQMAYFNDMPIIVIDEDNDGNEILPFTEENPGGGTPASTSIYCLSLTTSGCCGHQTYAPRVRELNESSAPGEASDIVRFDWPAGMSIKDPRSACRIRGITNSSITLAP